MLTHEFFHRIFMPNTYTLKKEPKIEIMSNTWLKSYPAGWFFESGFVLMGRRFRISFWLMAFFHGSCIILDEGWTGFLALVRSGCLAYWPRDHAFGALGGCIEFSEYLSSVSTGFVGDDMLLVIIADLTVVVDGSVFSVKVSQDTFLGRNLWRGSTDKFHFFRVNSLLF